MINVPFALLPCGDAHHQAGAPVDINISGKITAQTDALSIQFLISGELARVRLPAVDKCAQRRGNLWQSTCLELFASPANSPRYWEYNFSPSHHWAVFQFTGYRENPTDDESTTELSITTRQINDQQFELACQVPLPAPLQGQSIDIGVSAVIQDVQNNLYYYALIHCQETADFHNRDSFIIHVDADRLK